MNNPADFETVFNALKNILTPYSEDLVIVTDEAGHYYLNTAFIMKNKKPMYFGSVKINKKYVSFHLMPVYVFPELLETISPDLKHRMQGKSCFNFSKIDVHLFNELTSLTKNSVAAFTKAGYL